MVKMLVIPAILLALVLPLQAAISKTITYGDETKIVDVLDQKVWGQCPVPVACLIKGGPCGVETNRHVVVNCSNKELWPYLPSFQYYVIQRRTWSLDFSHNGITHLYPFSFLTENEVEMNLTELYLSHNYIVSIDPRTFRGNVSKDLHTLDLSYNSLAKLQDGTFDEMPALKILRMSHNRLLSIDPLCVASLPSVTTIDLGYNRISNVRVGCLSKAKSGVSLKLNNNFLGSINDCSYSDRIGNLDLNDNPTFCGCTRRTSALSCLKLPASSNTTTKSSQTGCTSTSKDCRNITFSINYDPIDIHKYNIKVDISGSRSHKLHLFQYTGLGNSSILSANLVDSDTQLKKSYNSKSSLSYGQNYTLCVTPGLDSEYRQRKCQYLTPNPYYGNGLSLSHSVYILTFAVVAGLMARL